MTGVDFVNAAFEAAAGFFVLNHCRVLAVDKVTSGVSMVSVVFFTVWGAWNLVYYPAISQPWSACAAVFVMLANALYLLLMVRYNRRAPVVHRRVEVRLPDGRRVRVRHVLPENHSFDDVPPSGRGVIH